MFRDKDVFFRKIQGYLWIALQFVSLLAILLTPLFLHVDGGGVNASVRLRGEDSKAQILDEEPNITSRVLSLPSLDEFRRSSTTLELKADTRQVRLEWVHVNSPAPENLRRGLASEARPLRLSRIERKISETLWEEVPLVVGEGRQSLGSVFIELLDGNNEFKITFDEGKRKPASFPLKIYK